MCSPTSSCPGGEFQVAIKVLPSELAGVSLSRELTLAWGAGKLEQVCFGRRDVGMNCTKWEALDVQKEAVVKVRWTVLPYMYLTDDNIHSAVERWSMNVVYECCRQSDVYEGHSQRRAAGVWSH